MKGWEVVVKWHGKSPSAVSKVFRGRRSVKSSAYPRRRQNSDSTRDSNRHEKLYGQESGRDEEESHPCPLQKPKQKNVDRVPQRQALSGTGQKAFRRGLPQSQPPRMPPKQRA